MVFIIRNLLYAVLVACAMLPGKYYPEIRG
jgi:hypothetical protein